MADDTDELDGIYVPKGLADDDAATAALKADIERMLAASDDDADPLGPMPKVENTTVSHETGLDLIDKARHGKPAVTDPQAVVAAVAADAPTVAADATPAADAAAVPEAAPADIKATDMEALLDGLPDDRRTEVARRMGEADQVMSIFKGREAELQMHGVSAHDAMARMIDLNEFAHKNPDEYIAWVAGQMNAAAPHEIMAKAAERLGYKLVPVDPEPDDEFADPEMKRLRAEVRELKGANKSTDFGPDTPERQSQRQVINTLQSFIEERGADGKPLRPAFPILRDRIGQLASERRAATGKPVTTEELHGLYLAAESEARQSLGIAAVVSAAQPAKPVAQPLQDKAAAVAKAQIASKTIDGSGQGAPRHPALSADASIGDIIRQQLAMQSDKD